VNELDAGSRALLDAARVAHLATADQYARPHVVPIVFVLDGDRLYFALDRKPKREDDWHALRRVRNIETNGRVSIVVDRYDEDWTKLAWVLLEGVATILEAGDEREAAAARLVAKYAQYQSGGLDARPVVRVVIERAVQWSGAPPE
jgi:PPOX class probable F420-dependent enzyme